MKMINLNKIENQILDNSCSKVQIFQIILKIVLIYYVQSQMKQTKVPILKKLFKKLQSFWKIVRVLMWKHSKIIIFKIKKL